MISRIWHGWTTAANADKYQALLTTVIIPGIPARKIPGYRSIRVDRRTSGDEVEFVTTMVFDSLEAVKEFAGGEMTTSVVPAAARALLARFDEHAAHYEVIEV
jgi:antibiotic biosynthesis monooxygenase (ABM) superfamily enzyme